MARRWFPHVADEANRRNSAFIPRPELHDEHPGPASSIHTNSDPPALRKRLSMFARRRTSTVWLSAREIDEISIAPRPMGGLTASQSSFALNSADATGLRSSLRRTSRIMSGTNLAPDSLTRWIHGSDKPSEPSQPIHALRSRQSSISISAPFDFQHISHTAAHKLPKLQDVGTNVFADEVLAASGQNDNAPAPDARPSTATSDQDGPFRVRSSSIASIISNQQRAAPTMVHPALRTDSDVASSEFASQAWLAPLIHRDSGVASIKSLAVVPEEQEPESPVQEQQRQQQSMPILAVPATVEPKLEATSAANNNIVPNTSAHKGPASAGPTATVPAELAAEVPAPASEKSFLRMSTGSVEFNDLRNRKSSVPSLTSAADSWEEDIDYCYSVEAESSCNFSWTQATRIQNNSPRDSLMPSQSARLNAELERANESPRASIARQQEKMRKAQRNSSSEVHNDEAFRNPRRAPETPSRTSSEWPLPNTPPANYETTNPLTASPAVLTTPASLAQTPSHELKHSGSQTWGYTLSSRWRVRNHGSPVAYDSPAPPSSGASPVPPPSAALPKLPQPQIANGVAVTSGWI